MPQPSSTKMEQLCTHAVDVPHTMVHTPSKRMAMAYVLGEALKKRGTKNCLDRVNRFWLYIEWSGVKPRGGGGFVHVLLVDTALAPE